jgi:chromosome partitioning protein
MLIVVGGIKGGSGKTTIATNLAVMRAQECKVLLVDADEQKSAWDWAQQREAADISLLRGTFSTVCMSGKAIHSSLLRLKPDYDEIIIDTGGRDTTSQRSALCIADKLILPFKPSSIDIWTMVPIKAILDECVNTHLKVYAVISQADASGKDNQEAIDILKEFQNIQVLDCTIGNRKAFRNAAAEGLGVKELFIRDKKACQEMLVLCHLIYG